MPDEARLNREISYFFTESRFDEHLQYSNSVLFPFKMTN